MALAGSVRACRRRCRLGETRPPTAGGAPATSATSTARAVYQRRSDQRLTALAGSAVAAEQRAGQRDLRRSGADQRRKYRHRNDCGMPFHASLLSLTCRTRAMLLGPLLRILRQPPSPLRQGPEATTESGRNVTREIGHCRGKRFELAKSQPAITRV